MGPTSPVLLAGLLALCVAAMVWLPRSRLLALRMVSAVLVLAVAMIAGVVVVNDYYGYYRTWGDLGHDFASPAPRTLVAARAVARSAVVGRAGDLVSVEIAGQASGIKRNALVYLPPQYRDPAFRSVRFPVLELLHGSPGRPSDWIYGLHAPSVVERAIALRRLGPMVLVMPQIASGNAPQECLNSNRAPDETYLTTDLRRAVLARFRVSADPAEWGLLGYSSGGYCAANLALRHRGLFGSAASMDGYYQASDGPAARILGNDPAVLAANSPVSEAARLGNLTAPIPSFWISVGTGNSDDERQAKLFASAMGSVENVAVVTMPGQDHNFYAWQTALPTALTWSWQQLSPPDLRVMFPVSGSSSVLTAPPPPKVSRHRLRQPASSGSSGAVVKAAASPRSGIVPPRQTR